MEYLEGMKIDQLKEAMDAIVETMEVQYLANKNPEVAKKLDAELAKKYGIAPKGGK